MAGPRIVEREHRFRKEIGAETMTTVRERRFPVGRFVWKLPSYALILLVRIYQIFIGPVLGKHCRFHPSCSQYFILAVDKYGAIVGTWKGACRIARCHPWHPGGYDPP